MIQKNICHIHSLLKKPLLSANIEDYAEILKAAAKYNPQIVEDLNSVGLRAGFNTNQLRMAVKPIDDIFQKSGDLNISGIDLMFSHIEDNGLNSKSTFGDLMQKIYPSKFVKNRK